MSAGTAYSKRYAGGFFDKPSTASPIDSAFLNAVESALLQLIGSAPTADGQVMQWDFANTRYGPALLLNKNVDAAAAIAKSKIDFTGANGIVNADIAGAAAIARSKLNFGSGLVDADISTAAAIAISKLASYPTDGAKFLAGDGTWKSAGLTVATSTAGLPGSPASGAQAMLRIGASPYDFVLLTYDSTYAKWVSAPTTFPLWPSTNAAVSQTDVTAVAEVGPANQPPFNGILYKALVDAGLTMQARLTLFQIADPGKSNNVQIGHRTWNAGDAVTGTTSFNATVMTVAAGGGTQYKDTGWLTMSPTSKNFIGFCIGGFRSSGGSGISISFTAPTISYRWVV